MSFMACDSVCVWYVSQGQDERAMRYAQSDVYDFCIQTASFDV